MQNLLKMLDLSGEEIIEILNLADQLKYEQKHGMPHPHLAGKTLGMLFRKASTRTRVSFEVGMVQLGGHPLILNAEDLQIRRGEPVQDTARVLSRYLDALMIRTFDQQEAEDFAAHGSIPVINALTDFAHPCQVLADLMTIREYRGKLDGLKLCYIGNGNNVANSLVVGGLKTGMTVAAATPEAFRPAPAVLEFASGYTDRFTLTTDSREAVREADVVVTDAWISMGGEADAEGNRAAFQGFQVNAGLMTLAKPEAMVLHCLPARREEEITEEVFEAHAKEIFDEAENRLHAQKAVLVKLMKYSQRT